MDYSIISLKDLSRIEIPQAIGKGYCRISLAKRRFRYTLRNNYLAIQNLSEFNSTKYPVLYRKRKRNNCYRDFLKCRSSWSDSRLYNIQNRPIVAANARLNTSIRENTNIQCTEVIDCEKKSIQSLKNICRCCRLETKRVQEKKRKKRINRLRYDMFNQYKAIQQQFATQNFLLKQILEKNSVHNCSINQCNVMENGPVKSVDLEIRSLLDEGSKTTEKSILKKLFCCI